MYFAILLDLDTIKIYGKSFRVSIKIELFQMLEFYIFDNIVGDVSSCFFVFASTIPKKLSNEKLVFVESRVESVVKLLLTADISMYEQ